MFLLKKPIAAQILPPTGPVLLARVRCRAKRARDTAESAILSARILKAAGVTRVSPPSMAAGFLPGGLGASRQALNEYVGQLYNRPREN